MNPLKVIPILFVASALYISAIKWMRKDGGKVAPTPPVEAETRAKGLRHSDAPLNDPSVAARQYVNHPKKCAVCGGKGWMWVGDHATWEVWQAPCPVKPEPQPTN
jgi:hypothetical protein